VYKPKQKAGINMPA